MKKMLRQLELIILVLILCISLSACGDSEREEKETVKISKDKKSDKDEEEEEEEEDEEKKENKKGESEEEEFSLTKEEEKALKLIVEEWTNYLDIVEEDSNAIVQTKENLGEIDRKKCSKELRMVIDQCYFLIDEFAYLIDWQHSLEKLSEEMYQLDEACGEVDILNLKSKEEVANLYNSIKSAVAVMEEMECPQFMRRVIDRMTVVYQTYLVILRDMYQAESNNDFMSYYSDLCFYEEMLSEEEDILDDLNLLTEEYDKHMQGFLDRFDENHNEFLQNIKMLKENSNEELKFSYLETVKKANVSINCISTIYPAVYNRLQAVSILNISCPQGEKDVLITVEVEGFSQKYEKTITAGRIPQRLYVKPPVLTSGLNLDNQKNTQIKVSVKDVETGNVIASETENVKIMSINDFILSNDDYGFTNNADILAWITPESNYIQDVLRIAAGNMYDYVGYEGITGYQKISSKLNELNTTAYQVYAIQKAISDIGVRYIMSSYSIGEAMNATQRVNRPEETLVSKNGICIETSVLLASALQAAGFNSMIVLTTGHCQVAVETWNGSGEYILVETTLLPIGGPLDSYGESNYLNSLMKKYSNEEWKSYLDQKNGKVYKCNLATAMGITPLIY